MEVDQDEQHEPQPGATPAGQDCAADPAVARHAEPAEAAGSEPQVPVADMRDVVREDNILALRKLLEDLRLANRSNVQFADADSLYEKDMIYFERPKNPTPVTADYINSMFGGFCECRQSYDNLLNEQENRIGLHLKELDICSKRNTVIRWKLQRELLEESSASLQHQHCNLRVFSEKTINNKIKYLSDISKLQETTKKFLDTGLKQDEDAKMFFYQFIRKYKRSGEDMDDDDKDRSTPL